MASDRRKAASYDRKGERKNQEQNDVIMQEDDLNCTGQDDIPDGIWNEVYRILDSVSDECGEQHLSNGYILKFEGWSPNCFADVEDVFNGDGQEYARSNTPDIVNDHWVPVMPKRKCKLLEWGYEPGGLYGVTWAIFRRLRKKPTGQAG